MFNKVFISVLLALNLSMIALAATLNPNEKDASSAPVSLIAGKEKLTLYPNGTVTNGKDEVKLVDNQYMLGNRIMKQVPTASGITVYLGNEVVKADGNYKIKFYNYDMSTNGTWKIATQTRLTPKEVAVCLTGFLWCAYLAFKPTTKRPGRQ